MKHKHIAILDFGSQYMHLISRRVRQLGVLAKIYPTDVNAHDLKDAWGVIISGGPNSVNDQKLPYDPGIFALNVPILGLCYGHQLMTHHYGGVVTPAHNREYGMATLNITDDSSLLSGLQPQEQVWMSHWDSVTKVPDGFNVTGTTDDCPVGAMANVDAMRYGLQFHPEVHHTTNGMRILENFVFNICGAEQNWTMEEYLQELTEEITNMVGERKVFLFVSGGVDSSVAFSLLEQVLGKGNVYGLHVDNGFMRANESTNVKAALAAAGFDDLHVVDASKKFLEAVKGMVDPEEKRNVIGRVFLEVQREVFAEMALDPEEWMLGQGTIYPDTIETGGTKASDTIKTHHNRVPEIVELINAGKVVEPLANLYKDEVRELGKQMGLPEKLLSRWPFPGPGLAIRCLCSDGTETVKDRAGINTAIEEITAVEGLTGEVMSVRSVGVQGDQRSYQHPAVIHGANGIAWKKLGKMSVKITNDIAGVNRVVAHVGGVVDFSHMQMKEAYLTRQRLDLLRKVDSAVDKVVKKYNLIGEMWQFPVILLPVTFGSGESVVLRPIQSQEAMTVNFYPMDKKVLLEMVDAVLAVKGIEAVFYDITNKPPATIEWE